MRYVKWSVVSLFIYSILTLLALIIDDLGWKRGVTEGSYQLIANLISNIQFLFKQLLGMDDVINYNFRLIPFILGAMFWVILALLFCRKRKKQSL